VLKGYAPPIVELSIVDIRTGQQIMTHEVWIRGSNEIMGYHNDEAATKMAITPEGWLKSGDLDYLDEERFLYIVDRVNDIVIHGQHQPIDTSILS